MHECTASRLGTDSQLAGNDPLTTSKLLGHASPRTTEKYYIHLDGQDRYLADAAAKAARG